MISSWASILLVTGEIRFSKISSGSYLAIAPRQNPAPCLGLGLLSMVLSGLPRTKAAWFRRMSQRSWIALSRLLSKSAVRSCYQWEAINQRQNWHFRIVPRIPATTNMCQSSFLTIIMIVPISSAKGIRTRGMRFLIRLHRFHFWFSARRLGCCQGRSRLAYALVLEPLLSEILTMKVGPFTIPVIAAVWRRLRSCKQQSSTHS